MYRLFFKFPLVTSVIILGLLIKYEQHKSRKSVENKNKEFWENETLSNSVRKKDISNLNYITIDEKNLPIISTDDNTINSFQSDILSFKDKKILNLTGISNTELKLKYGVANLTALSEYDSNYTDLCRLLNSWGAYLYKKGFVNESTAVLEFAITTGTDISETYRTLSSIYKSTDSDDKIDNLLEQASHINSISKDRIIASLEKLKDSSI